MIKFCRNLGNFAPAARETIAKRFVVTLPPEVVIFPKEEMAVCWHPEKKFPYEFSKPLPKLKPEAASVLRIKEAEAKLVFARKPKLKELAVEMGKLTHTTMHPWFPRSRDKRAKKTKPDRPYL